MRTLPISFFQLLKHPVYFLGLGMGSGLASRAPGTWGTLAALPIYLVLHSLPLIGYILITALAFVLGIWICQRTADWLGHQDPGAVVWDEIVGFLVTMTAAPEGGAWLVLGFILFRFFDILKPWPINLADKLFHGGFGIMFDDLLAGLFAWICIQWLAQADTLVIM